MLLFAKFSRWIEARNETFSYLDRSVRFHRGQENYHDANYTVIKRSRERRGAILSAVFAVPNRITISVCTAFSQLEERVRERQADSHEAETY